MGENRGLLYVGLVVLAVCAGMWMAKEAWRQGKAAEVEEARLEAGRPAPITIELKADGGKAMAHNRGDLYSVAHSGTAPITNGKYRLSVETAAGKRVSIRMITVACYNGGDGIATVVRAAARSAGGTGDATQTNLNGKAAATSGCVAKYTNTTDDLTLTSPVTIASMAVPGTGLAPSGATLILKFEPGEFVIEDGQVCAVHSPEGASAAGQISTAIIFQPCP